MQVTEPEEIGFSPDRLNRISRLMQGYVDRGELAGMLATVSRGGQRAYLERFGMMDIEARKPMQFDTIFRIASMTKPVTCAAIMQLYEEGHFHLNTPISKFIPAFKDTKVCVGEKDGHLQLADLAQPITFRHLFTHTAGLSYGGNESDPVDRAYRTAQKKMQQDGVEATSKNIIEGLAQLPLAFQPGTHWRYSMAIDVLGYLIEVISGMSLGEFLRQRVFEPLGMTETGFYVSKDNVERVAAVYGPPKDGKKLQRLDMPPQTEPPSFESGGGGLISTLHDYDRFARMLTNGGALDGVQLLSPTTVAMFSMNHAPVQALPYGFVENDMYHAGYGYSFGTRVLMDVSKSGIAGNEGEFGWDGAFSTYFWVDPVEELYGVLMVQHLPNTYYPVAQQFKQLTYQAMVQ